MTNSAYTDQQKLDFAWQIFAAFPTDAIGWDYYDRLRRLIHYWGVFVPFPPRTRLIDEGEVAYIESLYEQLRPYAFEWVTNHRLTALEAAVERLFTSTDPRLWEHR